MKKIFNKVRENVWLLYTFLFIFAALGVFIWHILYRRSFVWYIDGVDQLYRAFIYYSGYLRTIIKGILSGEGFIAPHWEYALGEGEDFVNVLHYYGVGDPFNLLSVLVPQKLLVYLFDLLLILKIYIAGVAFIFLCRETLRNKSNTAVTAGAVAYALSTSALFFVTVHILMVNVLIYLPLLILGEIKIINGKRPYLFVIAVALTLASNIYLFVILAAIVAVYAVEKLIFIFHTDLKSIVLTLLQIGVFAFLGIAIAAIIAFPIIYFCLINSRMGNGTSEGFFYPLSFYITLKNSLFSFPQPDIGYGTIIGLTAPALLALILLYARKKENTWLKILGVTILFSMLFPFLGRIFNGFAYSSNRWNFVIALFLSYVLVVMWDDLIRLSKPEAFYIFMVLSALLVLCVISEDTGNSYTLYGLILSYALMSALLLFEKFRAGLLVITFMTNLFINAFLHFSPYGDKFLYEDIRLTEIEKKMTADVSSAVNAAAQKDGNEGFYRYSSHTYNKNLLAGLSSSDFYWSLANPYSFKFRNDIEHNEGIVYKYNLYDNRTILNTLDSVKYYALAHEGGEKIPYGYSYITTIDSNGDDEFDIYKNDNFLPLGYTYDTFIPKEEWLTLNAAERENAMLDSAVIEEPESSIENLKNTGYTAHVREIPFEIINTNPALAAIGNSIYATEEYQAMELKLDGDTTGGELFCEVTGLDFTPTSPFALYFGDDERFDPNHRYSRGDLMALSFDDKRQFFVDSLKYSTPLKAFLVVVNEEDYQNEIKYLTEANSMFSNRRDFIANMCYSDKEQESLWLTFKERGVYSFDKIRIFLNPMEDYTERVNKLKETVLENIELGNDTITGTLSAKKDKLLCMTMPYSTGWRAFIDGSETKVYRTNDMFMSICVPAGEHDIEFKYETPFYRLGCIVTGVSIVLFAVMIVIMEKRKSECFSVKGLKGDV